MLCLAHHHLWGPAGPSQMKVDSEMPIRPFPKEGCLGTLLAFFCHEASPVSQEHYSSCWQTTGPGWGEAAPVSLFSEVRRCSAPSSAPTCIPVSAERLHQAL